MIKTKITVKDLLPLLQGERYSIWDNDKRCQITTTGRSVAFINKYIPDDIKNRRVLGIGYNKDIRMIELTLQEREEKL